MRNALKFGAAICAIFAVGFISAFYFRAGSDICRAKLERGLGESVFNFSRSSAISDARLSHVRTYCDASPSDCDDTSARIVTFSFEDTSYWLVYSNSENAGPSRVFCEGRTLDS